MCMKVENKKSQRPREGDKKKKKCNAMTLKTISTEFGISKNEMERMAISGARM